MNTRSPLCLAPICICALIWGLVLEAPLNAAAPAISKLYAGNPKGQISDEFGESLASNEKWIVIGEPSHTELATDDGAVHVFNAQTGVFVRRIALTPGQQTKHFGFDVAVHGDRCLIGQTYGATLVDLRTGKLLREFYSPSPLNGNYGVSVALSGDYALVGDPTGTGLVDQTGVVHVFDVDTGTVLFTLKASDGAMFDYFGWSIAVEGRTALIGARYADGSGAAYAYDLHTGLQIRKMSPTNGANGDQFGESVALGSHRAIIGAPIHDSYRGAVYVYDLATGAETILSPTDPAIDDDFGKSVSADGDLVLIGAFAKKVGAAYFGAAYLFDHRTGTQLQKFVAGDATDDDLFGHFVSLKGNVAVITASRDDDLNDDSGAAYVYRQVTSSLSLETLVAKKHFAPGVPGATFSSFANPAINSQGETLFTGVLSGPGATASKNQGLWSTLNFGQQVGLALRKGDDVGGLRISSILPPIMNQSDVGLVEAGLVGSGVNASNNRVLLSCNGGSYVRLAGLGDELSGLAGTKVSKFLQVVQSFLVNRQAVAVRLSGGVTPASDSAIAILDNSGAVVGSVREGQPAPMGGLVGQVSRVSMTALQSCFATGLAGLPGQTQALLQFSGASPTLVARQGDPAPGGGGAVFGTFTGETCSILSFPLFRSTLTGAGVTLNNNLGLWHKPAAGMPLKMVVQKGDVVPNVVPGDPAPLSGVRWKNFVQFWGMDGASEQQVLFVADMTGNGISAANDRALWLKDEAGNFSLLLREGDYLQDGSGARISNFQRIVANGTSGDYAVLVGLRGAKSSTNQALLTGNTKLGMPFEGLRAADLRLRKGNLYRDASGNLRSIRSMSIAPSGTDATGAGSKGLAQAIGFGGPMVLTLQFSDGSVELVTGKP
ncbi:MAG: FG-GAP repeat protein [Verrucomicrobiales bacterium]|nr:FG-GAP repeat protein [Verrucomicrobiales bacterium]MCP5559824.1 FG-GAP repeat protein [Verrucomicrobiaceae bacterium]